MKLKKIIISLFAILFIFTGFALASNGDMVLSLDQLKEYDGKDGRPAYVAVDGVIYDFTESMGWIEGEHNGFEAGRDLSQEIKDISPHGLSVLERMPVVGRLEGYNPSQTSSRSNLYSLCGWLSVIILVIMVLPFVLTRLNKVIKTKNKGYFSFIKFLRKVHKPLGVIFVVVALAHGYLALGTLRLHTGSLLFTSLAITAILGGVFYKKKSKKVYTFHKLFALISVILLLIHYTQPWLI